MTPCSLLCFNRRFGGTYHPHLHNHRCENPKSYIDICLIRQEVRNNISKLSSRKKKVCVLSEYYTYIENGGHSIRFCDVPCSDSSVSKKTDYGLDGRGSIPGRVEIIQTGFETNPVSYPVGTGALSQGVKRQGREADHSLPSSAEIKNGGAMPPLPHMSSWRGA
jgi:hypothetical protein